jgi:hypothetical protein
MKYHSLPWLSLVLAAVLLHTPLSIQAADLPAKPSADPYPVGARVEVRRNNQWLPATIVKRDGAKAFVKFDGATDSFNEWVEGTQIREASVVTATGPATLPGAVQPGKPATKAAPDPFAVGAEIEAIFQGHWTDAKVLSRTSTTAEVIFMDAFKETVDATKMRVRGVSPEEAAKLTSQGGLFRAGAKIEYKWGNRWYDGVITRRNETEIEIKTSDGFTHRAGAGDLRTRAVAPPLPPQAPAAVETAATSVQGTSPTTPAVPAVAPIPLADQSKMLTVAPNEAGGLRAKPDPATQPIRPLLTANPIFIPPMNRAGKLVAGRVSRIILNPGTTRGIVEYLTDGSDAIGQIFKIDIATGILGPAIDLPDGMLAEDISPDGKRVLLRKGGDGANLLQVCSIEPKPGAPALAKIKEFQPFGTAPANKIIWAAFIDSDHVVCAIGGGNLIMVDLPSLKAVWTIDGMNGCFGALSPGRNLLACSTHFGACLLEPLTGRVVQVLEGRIPWNAALWFSPDGKRLAAVGTGAMLAWDLEAQDQPREIMLAGTYTHRVDWLSNEYVIVGGYKLVDLDKRLVTWHYLHPEGERQNPITCTVAGKFWYLTVERVANGARRQLLPVALPHDEAAKVTSVMKPEELFLLHPGSKVSLQISVGADADQQQKIVAGLTGALKRAGMEVADGQPVTLEATSTTGESRQMVFHRFGAFGGGGETVTVTPTILELAIKLPDGKVAWSIKGRTGDVFGMVSIKAGQSVQDAVAEAQKPNYSLFYNPNVPSYIPVPREKEGFGESNLTVRGLQPAKVGP